MGVISFLSVCNQVNKATACLIIADKECPDPDGDDSANIMRVISLKNFNQRSRILLQLLQYKNKVKYKKKQYIHFNKYKNSF